MEFWVDTASLEEVKDGALWGGGVGVTTYPSVRAREAGDPVEILLEICEGVEGAMAAEGVATVQLATGRFPGLERMVATHGDDLDPRLA